MNKNLRKCYHANTHEDTQTKAGLFGHKCRRTRHDFTVRTIVGWQKTFKPQISTQTWIFKGITFGVTLTHFGFSSRVRGEGQYPSRACTLKMNLQSVTPKKTPSLALSCGEKEDKRISPNVFPPHIPVQLQQSVRVTVKFCVEKWWLEKDPVLIMYEQSGVNSLRFSAAFQQSSCT